MGTNYAGSYLLDDQNTVLTYMRNAPLEFSIILAILCVK